MITDDQAKRFAIKLSEYCKTKSLDDCSNNNCALRKVCGQLTIIEKWEEILKEEN